MERSELCLSHDLEPTSIGQVALRCLVDRMIDDADRGAFFVLNKLIEMDTENA